MQSLTPEFLAALCYDDIHVATLRKQPFAISEIEAAGPGVSHDMVRLVLRAMKADGLIASTGTGRSAKWVNHATAGLTREPHAHRQ